MDESTIWQSFGAEPPQLEAQVAEWIQNLYTGAAGEPGLVSRYFWLRDVFRGAERQGLDADELLNETLLRYLGPIKSKLWAAAAGQIIRDQDTLMPAIRWIAKQLKRPVPTVKRECLCERQHEELINRYYGNDSLTVEELELDQWRDQALSQQRLVISSGRKPDPGPPVDPVGLAYQYPEAALRQIAKRVLIDQSRKVKAEGELRDELDLTVVVDESIQANPEAKLREKQLRVRYLQAVQELPKIQRAAWILCRDHLLNDSDVEALLAPALTVEQASQAAAARPLLGEEAAQLFGRDVSPDAAKAARKLVAVLKRD